MAMVKDPVCGMEMDSSQAPAQTVYKDQAYYFCSEDCRRTFEENPKEFIQDGDDLLETELPVT